jgi:hypothetical protein
MVWLADLKVMFPEWILRFSTMIGHTPYSLNLDTPMEHSEFFTRNESNELRALITWEVCHWLIVNTNSY